MSKSQKLIFDDFQTFYNESVLPLKSQYRDCVRLDGKTEGSNRKAFGYFKYQDQVWKVDADTYIEKLDIAFLMCSKSTDPFIVRQTRDGRGKCLTIMGEPLAPKRFYVYLSKIKLHKPDVSDGIK